MFDLYATQEIYFKERTGTKDNGAPILAAVDLVLGRYDYRRRIVRTEKGEEIVSEVAAMLPASCTIKPGDVLTIDGRDWPVVAVEPVCGLGNKVLHYEVSL